VRIARSGLLSSATHRAAPSSGCTELRVPAVRSRPRPGSSRSAHGQHVVARLPDAELYHLPGESHLAGLGRGEEILRTMLDVWDREDQR
jgi:hypothetical protein